MTDQNNSLPNGDAKSAVFLYDKATIAMLEQRSEDAFSAKSKTFSVRQSMERLKENRKRRSIG